MQREQHGPRHGAVEHTVFVEIGKQLKTTGCLAIRFARMAQSLKTK